MSLQRTLKKSIHATGIGLHSGKKVHLSLFPAAVDTGVVFERTDIKSTSIKLSPEVVSDTKMSTSISNGEITVSTIEHILSAISGLGIDNIIIQLSASEVPIMDGSASPFVYLLKSAGIKKQSKNKKYIKILKPMEVRIDDKIARIEPYEGFKLSFRIDFKHPAFKHEHNEVVVDFSTTAYEDEISRARTFGFMKDVEYLRSIGLAKGASLDNAVGLDEFRVLNTDGLRYDDEFARHKILDAVGDLYLLGAPVLGAYYGYKSGHELNNHLCRAIMADETCYEVISYEDSTTEPVIYPELSPA